MEVVDVPVAPRAPISVESFFFPLSLASVAGFDYGTLGGGGVLVMMLWLQVWLCSMIMKLNTGDDVIMMLRLWFDGGARRMPQAFFKTVFLSGYYS
ncbi:hypothetical protein HanRHA438_Chr16g0745761 [Helianthus annuus]|nr:hypothetical protein HanHA300_Chr16g0597901 [Helianthus annuus]KAJ0459385.1 hypothetical protein HanHA89_Chr16g0648361 [Helianthus annuus]KAJ0643875.1 hypothetical protein HanOQP8_Chr16g0605461 [Helianthus annuus]KAJ0834625.1 hypothetical protein HanRHA438_Chr16g0745761 [Helianthus annuus]